MEIVSRATFVYFEYSAVGAWKSNFFAKKWNYQFSSHNCNKKSHFTYVLWKRPFTLNFQVIPKILWERFCAHIRIFLKYAALEAWKSNFYAKLQVLIFYVMPALRTQVYSQSLAFRFCALKSHFSPITKYVSWARLLVHIEISLKFTGQGVCKSNFTAKIKKNSILCHENVISHSIK